MDILPLLIVENIEILVIDSNILCMKQNYNNW